MLGSCAEWRCEYLETWAAFLKTKFERMFSKDKEETSATRTLHGLLEEEVPELAVPAWLVPPTICSVL